MYSKSLDVAIVKSPFFFPFQTWLFGVSLFLPLGILMDLLGLKFRGLVPLTWLLPPLLWLYSMQIILKTCCNKFVFTPSRLFFSDLPLPGPSIMAPWSYGGPPWIRLRWPSPFDVTRSAARFMKINKNQFDQWVLDSDNFNNFTGSYYAQ